MFTGLSLAHRILKDIVKKSACLLEILMDNGPEFILTLFAKWPEYHHIQLEFIQSGTPTHNAYHWTTQSHLP